MRYQSIIHIIILQLYYLTFGYAATIPAAQSLSHDYPSTNHSSAYKLLQVLNRYEPEHGFQDTTLRTNRRWPAAPFDFESQSLPGWLLHVVFYEPARFNFRQLHAMVDLVYNAQELIKLMEPEAPMLQRTYIFRATQREPTDLSHEDVELVFFNSANEPGLAYSAMEMYIALDVMLEKILPLTLPDMMRAVVHYAQLEPRNGSLLHFRKMVIRRNTRTLGSAAAAVA
ncbi:MAG: hypothetical protein L6R40_007814 [Gallowayella cf. fulva]|nr:MAG: hypothetical protein L6R40_007814 [Xanthomendoza cf. fulva]